MTQLSAANILTLLVIELFHQPLIFLKQVVSYEATVMWTSQIRMHVILKM